MSILGRKVSIRAIAIVALLLLGGLLPVMSETPSREITLVAKGMAFYVAGDMNTPNPVIHLRAGENVRVVLRNEDRGMTHDFAVPALGEALDPLHWNERADVTFDVPETPGTYAYVCRPHMLMMNGRIIVHP